MWDLDYKESWVPKNWCFRIVVLVKTLESPLDCKEIKPGPKGNQSWIFTGRTDDEAEAPVLWPPDIKNWLIGKKPDAGKDWGQGEKGTTDDEMVGWHHWLNGHGFEQAPGVGNGQGSLACCSPWGRKKLNMTERLNWTIIKDTTQEQSNRKIIEQVLRGLHTTLSTLISQKLSKTPPHSHHSFLYDFFMQAWLIRSLAIAD